MNTNTLVLGNIATQGFERFKSSEGQCNDNDIIIVKINRRNRNSKYTRGIQIRIAVELERNVRSRFIFRNLLHEIFFRKL